MSAKKAPDILLVHVAKRAGDQHGRPIAVASGRLVIEQRQNSLAGFGAIFRLRAAVSCLAEARDAILGITHPPFRRRADRAADLARNRPRRGSIRRQQNNARLEMRALFRLRRTHQALKLAAFVGRQNNRGRFGNGLAAHAALNHESAFCDSWY